MQTFAGVILHNFFPLNSHQVLPTVEIFSDSFYLIFTLHFILCCVRRVWRLTSCWIWLKREIEKKYEQFVKMAFLSSGYWWIFVKNSYLDYQVSAKDFRILIDGKFFKFLHTKNCHQLEQQAKTKNKSTPLTSFKANIEPTHHFWNNNSRALTSLLRFQKKQKKVIFVLNTKPNANWKMFSFNNRFSNYL